MKRVFSLFTCLFIILTGFILLKPAYAIKDFHMDIKSRQAGKKATYKFIFTIEKIVEVHTEIKLGFPQGTVIEPPIPEKDPERRERLTRIIESMSIGLSPCSACQGLPVIDFYDDGTMKSLKFNSHIELDPAKEGYSTITVTVPDVCGFVLPVKPGFYTYKISTHAEPTEISTQFEVVTSKIGDPTGIPDVIVDPPSPATEAKYVISFHVGRGGWLKGMSGLIKVRFPDGTKMTKPASEFKPEWTLVNKNPLAKAPNGTGTNINFTTPIEINDSDRIMIEFDIRCGITNPLKAGKYVLEVGTSAEEWVKSHEYEITKTSATFKLSNNKTNRNAVYQLIYIQEKGSLQAMDTIIVRFPKEVQFSSPIRSHNNGITVNDVPLYEVYTSEDRLTYELLVGDVEVKEGDPVKIEFDCPEIRNPSKPGFIKLEYRPNGYDDDDFIFSPAVEIVSQTLEITDVTITLPNALQRAKYSIQVIFGDNALPQKRITVYLEHLETIIDIEEVKIQEQA
ncbi:MAG: hypothetical protein PHD83_06285, partial [Caldisericia bacterium]|nr:hypothetical protein [Caldisericia bacterium]